MASIVSSVEVARAAPDVFAYLDDLSRHGEWQSAIQEVRVEGGDPTRVGTRAVETRAMGSRRMRITYEITEHEPGSSFAFRGIDGPIRVIGRGRVEALGEQSSRVTVELDFAGHGLGRLMVPLARRQARAQVPRDQQRLKAVLEGAGSP